MTRTTRKEVEAVFGRLCKAAGVPQGGVWDRETWSMSAGWSLDYSEHYGGWTIAGHSGVGSGESRPFGEWRMPAREFVQAMRYAIRMAEGMRMENLAAPLLLVWVDSVLSGGN